MSEGVEPREPDQLEGVRPAEYQSAVIGHEAALTDLRGRLERGRLPGGVLLHGPRGIGKATLTFQIAREIFTATSDEEPSHIAAQVAAGGYPNLFVLRKAPKDTGKGFYTVIRVEEVRELIERLHRTRGRAGHRVVIVDPIDDCNVSSANALLKIVEEPPPDTLFLLVSHRPGQLLPTIKSRCHPIALRPLSDAGVRAVVAANRPDVEGEAVERAVALANGRPRRAFEALLLSDAGVLTALKAWLADPVSARPAVHLGLADALGTKRDSAEARFGRDIVLAWLAGEAREAAVAGPAARSRLASANELWDKAVALFEDTDEYYLDARQTLVAIFDAIRKHLQHHSPVSEPT